MATLDDEPNCKGSSSSLHHLVNGCLCNQMKLFLLIITLNCLLSLLSSSTIFSEAISLSRLALNKNLQLKCDFEQDLCFWRNEVKYNNGLKWHRSPNHDHDTSNTTNDSDGYCVNGNNNLNCRHQFSPLKGDKSNRYLYVTSDDLKENGSYVRISHSPLAAQSSGHCILTLKYIAYGVGFAKLIIGLRLIDYHEIEPILVIYSSQSSDWKRVRVPLIANYIFTPIIEAKHDDDDKDDNSSLSSEDDDGRRRSSDGFIAIDDAEISRGCIHDPTDGEEEMKLTSILRSEFQSVNNKQPINIKDMEIIPMEERRITDDDEEDEENEDDDDDDDDVGDTKVNRLLKPRPKILNQSAKSKKDKKKMRKKKENKDDIKEKKNLTHKDDKEKDAGNNTQFNYDYIIVNADRRKRIPQIVSKKSNLQVEMIRNSMGDGKFDLNHVFNLNKSKELQEAIKRSLENVRKRKNSEKISSNKKDQDCVEKHHENRGKVKKSAKASSRISKLDQIEETIVCHSDDSCVTTKARKTSHISPNSCTLDDINSQNDLEGNCGWTQNNEEKKFGNWLLISGKSAGKHFVRFPLTDSSMGTRNGKYLILNMNKSHVVPTIHLNSPLFRDAQESCYFTFSYIIYDRNAIFYLHLITLSLPEEEDDEGEEEDDEKDRKDKQNSKVKNDDDYYLKKNQIRDDDDDDDDLIEYDETTYVIWKGQSNRKSKLAKWLKGSAFIGQQKNLFYLSFVRSSSPQSSFGTIALDDFKFVSC